MPRSRLVWKKLLILDNTFKRLESKLRMCFILIKININKKPESSKPLVKPRQLSLNQPSKWHKRLNSKEWMRKLKWERQRSISLQVRRVSQKKNWWTKNLSWERFRMPIYSISRNPERPRILFCMVLLTLVRRVFYPNSSVRKFLRPTKMPREEILLIMLLPNVSSKMVVQRQVLLPRSRRSLQEPRPRERLSLNLIKTPRPTTSKPRRKLLNKLSMSRLPKRKQPR